MRFSFDKYWSITKNKSLEIQLDIGKAEWDLFRFVFECRRNFGYRRISVAYFNN